MLRSSQRARSPRELSETIKVVLDEGTTLRMSFCIDERGVIASAPMIGLLWDHDLQSIELLYCPRHTHLLSMIVQNTSIVNSIAGSTARRVISSRRLQCE